MINNVITVIVIVAAALVLSFAVNYLARKLLRNNKDISISNIRILIIIAKIIIWISAIILVFSNLGYNVNSLIASLGIGGIAVALSVQNILSDVFCTFTIFIDKPFQVGDSIQIDDKQGIVKEIGILSTRIELLQGEELIISNKDLTSSRIQNYKRMHKRRVGLILNIDPQTKNEKLQKIPDILKTVIESVEDIEFGRAHFKAIGDFSLVYELVYFIKNNDYCLFMDKQQQINLEIKNRLEKENIKIIYKTICSI